MEEEEAVWSGRILPRSRGILRSFAVLDNRTQDARSSCSRKSRRRTRAGGEDGEEEDAEDEEEGREEEEEEEEDEGM